MVDDVSVYLDFSTHDDTALLQLQRFLM